ncbi:hypothetical protein NIES2100_10750 [Calothrix sp. NIES-2100]|nr:hypothetical protein NIES2100_10750 [Calothrix sp. NIES-2100]
MPLVPPQAQCPMPHAQKKSLDSQGGMDLLLMIVSFLKQIGNERSRDHPFH